MIKQVDELNTLIVGLKALQEFWIDAYLIEGSGPDNFMLQLQIETGEAIKAAAARGDIRELHAHWREMINDVRSLEPEERKTIESLIRKAGAYSLYVNGEQLRKQARKIVESNKIPTESNLQIVEDYWNFLKDAGYEHGQEEGEVEEYLGKHAK